MWIFFLFFFFWFQDQQKQKRFLSVIRSLYTITITRYYLQTIYLSVSLSLSHTHTLSRSFSRNNKKVHPPKKYIKNKKNKLPNEIFFLIHQIQKKNLVWFSSVLVLDLFSLVSFFVYHRHRTKLFPVLFLSLYLAHSIFSFSLTLSLCLFSFILFFIQFFKLFMVKR